MNDLIAVLTKAGAPILGGIIGGPVGALATAVVGALAEALGTPATPEAVKEAIETGGPAAEAAVRRVEADRGPGYIDELNARLADVQDARATTVKLTENGSAIAWAPVIVTSFVLTLVALVIGLVAAKWLPDNSLVVGWVLGSGSTAIAFWLGSSDGSRRNGDAMRNIAQQATTPSAGQVAGKVIDAAVKTASKH